jgi:hypothetical protein
MGFARQLVIGLGVVALVGFFTYAVVKPPPVREHGGQPPGPSSGQHQ